MKPYADTGKQLHALEGIIQCTYVHVSSHVVACIYIQATCSFHYTFNTLMRMSLREALKIMIRFFLIKFVQDDTYDIISEVDFLEDKREGVTNRDMYKRKVYAVDIIKMG